MLPQWGGRRRGDRKGDPRPVETSSRELEGGPAPGRLHRVVGWAWVLRFQTSGLVPSRDALRKVVLTQVVTELLELGQSAAPSEIGEGFLHRYVVAERC